MEKQSMSFKELGIAPNLLSILEKNNFIAPTPIQHQAIPAAIEGKDIIGVAQTGTGKTFAFGIPLIQNLMPGKGRGLILLPTRELALQVEEAFLKIGRSLGLHTATLIGGESMWQQLAALRRNPHVIIATPGRLMDHLKRRSTKMDDISIVVLDEADRMLDMGFAPDIEMILNLVPKERQTMLFSATMPYAIVTLASKHMKLPLRIEVAPSGTSSEKIEQEIFVVKREERLKLLEKVLGENKGSILIFTRTKHAARDIRKELDSMGYNAAEIHSDRTQPQRKKALEGFRAGKYQILVATDIAARGIDVKDIELVLNYDLPDNSEDYVHRIGRTGRAGKTGKAISFASPNQLREIRDIEKLIKKTLPMTKLTEFSVGGQNNSWGRKSPRRFNDSRRSFDQKSSWGDKKNVAGKTSSYKGRTDRKTSNDDYGQPKLKKGWSQAMPKRGGATSAPSVSANGFGGSIGNSTVSRDWNRPKSDPRKARPFTKDNRKFTKSKKY